VVPRIAGPPWSSEYREFIEGFKRYSGWKTILVPNFRISLILYNAPTVIAVDATLRTIIFTVPSDAADRGASVVIGISGIH